LSPREGQPLQAPTRIDGTSISSRHSPKAAVKAAHYFV
jgi:hypothetical protein